MKELSIEEKARAYDEALRIAQELYNDSNSSNVGKGYVCTIFPKLKESENERIREWIIDDIRYNMNNEPLNNSEYKKKAEKAIAWLEKRGKQKHTDKTESKFKAGDIIRRKAPSSYDKDMQVARIEKDYYICNHIGKFSSEVVPFSKESCYELVEQKPSDNVKPKFHEGEWCIDNEDDTIFQIVKVLDNIYTYRTNKGKEYSCTHYSLENDARLWIVENANDGDVLAYKDEISIYKHDIKNCTKEGTNFGGFVYHCCYDGKRFITDSLYSLTEKDKKDIYPATKEQRDTLFAKMKEAGYKFDFEKKELKKIENEIEIPFGAKDSELQEASYHIPKGFYAEVERNKVIIKRGEQKSTEWSEDDEVMLRTAQKVIFESDDCSDGTTSKLIDWLKSIKDRVQT